jgi:hypothetical protein
MYERVNVSVREVKGQYLQPFEPKLIAAIKQLAESDASAAQYENTIEDNKPVQAASSICSKINNVQCFPARSTRPGPFFHADTIQLGRCWNGMCEALVLVDGETPIVFGCLGDRNCVWLSETLSLMRASLGGSRGCLAIIHFDFLSFVLAWRGRGAGGAGQLLSTGVSGYYSLWFR